MATPPRLHEGSSRQPTWGHQRDRVSEKEIWVCWGPFLPHSGNRELRLYRCSPKPAQQAYGAQHTGTHDSTLPALPPWHSAWPVPQMTGTELTASGLSASLKNTLLGATTKDRYRQPIGRAQHLLPKSTYIKWNQKPNGPGKALSMALTTPGTSWCTDESL